jgi:glycosyltransferase involved in cell wall biosynthesis
MSKKLSIIIACYKDAEAIPVMHKRICDLNIADEIELEIIFVNDGSPDLSQMQLLEIGTKDARVIGIKHTRNFGSQAAFLSGMKISTGDAIVIMDGDLQDPPEMILDFIQYWQDGYEVVYGIRESREAPIYMQFFYKIFYRIFSKLSSFKVPKDAGDFSLMDRKVVNFLLSLQEREPFLRALRAYFGGKSVGVKYRRPERMFGKSTNSLLSNLGWASKGLVAVSRIPLNLVAGISLITVPIFMGMLILIILLNAQIRELIILFNIILSSLFILNLIQSSVIAIYLGKVMEDTKQRPLFIVDSIIRNGKEVKVEI